MTERAVSTFLNGLVTRMKNRNEQSLHGLNDSGFSDIAKLKQEQCAITAKP